MPPEPLPNSTAATDAGGRAPTPGIALAAGRVPGQPTLPDWDPASLTLAIQRVANEMFHEPPSTSVVPEPAHIDAPLHASGASPAVPTSSTVPSAAGEPPPAPAVGATPAPAPASTTPPSHAGSAPAPAPSHAGSAPAPSSVGAPALAAGAPAPAPMNPWLVEPTFDFAAWDAPADMRLPFVDGTPESAPPYFMPSPAVLSLESAPSIAPAAQHDALISDPTRGGFDAYAIKKEFPILEERVHGKRLVWLDNAATTQKPRAVIERLKYFYEHENSNIHRAAHALAARATDAYEGARDTVRKFLNAPSKNEIIFVRGATEGINLVANTWGRKNIGAGDEIVLTNLEHHANIVPWQMLAQQTGARIKVAPVDDRGQIIFSEYEKLLGPKTKLVALPQVSNALGTITPAREMIAAAHRQGARVLLDGAQSVSHMPVDLQQLDCDFFVFSGHKIFAPTGIGVVWGKTDLLEAMPPWQGGGNMIQDVTFESTTYQAPPWRFEAGTGNIADAVGLGAALDWLMKVGLPNVERHEHELLVYATEQLLRVPGLKIIGTAAEKAGVISFILAGHSTADVAAALDKEGVAVRGGHHCAQPILRRFGLESSVRASFAPYNVREDVDVLVQALHRLQANGGAR